MQQERRHYCQLPAAVLSLYTRQYTHTFVTPSLNSLTGTFISPWVSIFFEKDKLQSDWGDFSVEEKL